MPINPIVVENQLPGSPASEWDIADTGDGTFKMGDPPFRALPRTSASIRVRRSTSRSRRLPAYLPHRHLPHRLLRRHGRAQGRHGQSAVGGLPQTQPACLTMRRPDLIDCGNWAVSASWAVPSDAVSGVYFAKLIARSTPAAPATSSSSSATTRATRDLLFQTSDTTWQAYNQLRRQQLSTRRRRHQPGPRLQGQLQPAVRHARRDDGATTSSSTPSTRWSAGSKQRLRRQLHHRRRHRPQRRAAARTTRSSCRSATTSTGRATARQRRGGPRRRRQPRVLQRQRGLLEDPLGERASTARTRPTARWSPTRRRTPTHEDRSDRRPWTGTWRDPRFSPPADGGRPENALTGTLFTVNACRRRHHLGAGGADGRLRFWRNTSVATLAAGQTATLTADRHARLRVGRGSRQRLPSAPGSIRLSSTTTITSIEDLLDYGATYATGHRDPQPDPVSRTPAARWCSAPARCSWSWGLDSQSRLGAVAA